MKNNAHCPEGRDSKHLTDISFYEKIWHSILEDSYLQMIPFHIQDTF
jgi:hypothetical protein